MEEAGLLVLTDKPTHMMGDEPKHFIATRLTWEGHEFLDSIRNDTVWKKIKDTVKEKGVQLSYEILKALAVDYCKGLIGLGAHPSGSY